MTDRKVSMGEDRPQEVPTGTVSNGSYDEFYRLYSQYKRAGYELIAALYQANQKSREWEESGGK